MPINRARMAQEATQALPGPHTRAKAEEIASRRLADVKPWRKVKIPKHRFVVVIERVKVAVLADGGEAHIPDRLQRYIIGPYDNFKRADGDAQAWSIPPWSASVEPLRQDKQWSPEETFL